VRDGGDNQRAGAGLTVSRQRPAPVRWNDTALAAEFARLREAAC
jgi:hypothetical protein